MGLVHERRYRVVSPWNFHNQTGSKTHPTKYLLGHSLRNINPVDLGKLASTVEKLIPPIFIDMCASLAAINTENVVSRCQAAIRIHEKHQEVVQICKKMLMMKRNQLD
jgi:hypothetical protein